MRRSGFLARKARLLEANPSAVVSLSEAKDLI
jgi:hypothetical protein